MNLSLTDIVALRDAAVVEFKDIPSNVRLSGMGRALTSDETRAIAWFRASLALLKRKGVLQDHLIDTTHLETPDSETLED